MYDGARARLSVEMADGVPEEEAAILRYMRENQDVRRGSRRFDLDLFRQLNRQYADRPVIEAPRSLDAAGRHGYATQRARLLQRRVGLKGLRVLEVGCGAGDLSREMATLPGCSVVGVDIAPYPTWHEQTSASVEFLQGDLVRPDFVQTVAALGPFDRVVSLVVWEHVQHPYALLKAVHGLLSRTGRFYLRANLYRSAIASHLYREVFFPWPHLLFPEHVFEDYYRGLGLEPQVPSWLNKLCYAHYGAYFREIGFSVRREWLTQRRLDAQFYARFEEELSQYPLFDLCLDFFDVVLVRSPLLAARRAGQRLQRAAGRAWSRALEGSVRGERE